MSKQGTLYSFFSSFNNAYSAKRYVFTVFYSRIVFLLLKELYKQGLIDCFYLNPVKPYEVIVFPRYVAGKPVFKKIISISKPGRRMYTKLIILGTG